MLNLFCVSICGISSLALTLSTSTRIHAIGLCGLSGIAHGLMAVSALEMFHSKNSDTFRKMAGLCTLLIVAGKSIYEALTGHVMFEWLYFGLVGTPLVMTHLGGVAGGVLGFYGIRLFILYRIRITKK